MQENNNYPLDTTQYDSGEPVVLSEVDYKDVLSDIQHMNYLLAELERDVRGGELCVADLQNLDHDFIFCPGVTLDESLEHMVEIFKKYAPQPYGPTV